MKVEDFAVDVPLEQARLRSDQISSRNSAAFIPPAGTSALADGSNVVDDGEIRCGLGLVFNRPLYIMPSGDGW